MASSSSSSSSVSGSVRTPPTQTSTTRARDIRGLPFVILQKMASYLQGQDYIPFRNIFPSLLHRVTLDRRISWKQLQYLEIPSGRRFSSSLITHVDLSGFQGNWTEILRHIFQSFSSLHSIDVSCGGASFTGAHLQMISQGRPLLRHLVLRRNNHLTEAVVIALVQQLPHLESLDLSGCSCTDNTISQIAESCRNLRRLTIAHQAVPFSAGPSALQRMASNLLQLEHLTLDWHQQFEGSMTPLAQGFPRLHTLVVKNCAWNSRARQIFSAFPRIMCLDLAGCTQLSGTALPPEDCGLSSLNLTGCTQISRAVIERLISRSPSLHTVVRPDGTIWRRSEAAAAAPTRTLSFSPPAPTPPAAAASSSSSSSSSSMHAPTPLMPREHRGIKRRFENH